MKPRRLVINLCIAVLCLIWGSTWLVIKTGLEDLPPLWGAGLRFGLAAVVMALVVAVVGVREGGDPPPRWLSITVGLTSFAGSYAIVYNAEVVLPSGVVSVLWAVYPILQAMAGHWFLPGERLRPRQWLGFILGFLGILVLFSNDLESAGAGAVPAAVMLLASPVLATIGFTVTKRHGAGVNSMRLNRDAMAVGAVALLAASWLTEPSVAVQWTGRAIFSVAYLAIAGTVVAFGLYMWLLRYAPANHLSVIAYITPPLALTLGWFLGDERLTGTLIAGTLLILIGVVLARRG